MRNYKQIITLLIPAFFILGNSKNVKSDYESKWSGTVSFFEKRTGSEGFISEWHMDATITNDTGSVTHSSKYSDAHGYGQCRNNGKTELEVGIDDEKHSYSISVNVPGCNGTQTRNGVESPYPVTDETAITINDQPLRTSNTLSGRTSKTDLLNGLEIITIYTWHLTRR